MPHSYPPPTALPDEVEAVQELYRTRYGVTLAFDEAKRFLEGVAQFIYLTEIDDALRPLRQKIQRERGEAGPEH